MPVPRPNPIIHIPSSSKTCGRRREKRQRSMSRSCLSRFVKAATWLWQIQEFRPVELTCPRSAGFDTCAFKPFSHSVLLRPVSEFPLQMKPCRPACPGLVWPFCNLPAPGNITQGSSPRKMERLLQNTCRLPTWISEDLTSETYHSYPSCLSLPDMFWIDTPLCEGSQQEAAAIGVLRSRFRAAQPAAGLVKWNLCLSWSSCSTLGTP